MKTKRRPAGYTPEELAYFREDRWVEQRKKLRPDACHGGPYCWVEEGPPAYERSTTRGKCRGCGGGPGFIRDRPAHKNHWRKP